MAAVPGRLRPRPDRPASALDLRSNPLALAPPLTAGKPSGEPRLFPLSLCYRMETATHGRRSPDQRPGLFPACFENPVNLLSPGPFLLRCHVCMHHLLDSFVQN